MLQLPLYQNCQPKYNNTPQQDFNKGLKFERLFNYYEWDWKVKDDAKNNYLQEFKGLCGNSKALENFSNQQYKLARCMAGAGKVYGLDWHMVTGMGNSHPVENGFLWHHTLGVPYIPGTQVKGIIRSLIEQYLDETALENGLNKKALLHEWFGSEDKGLKEQSNDSTKQSKDKQTGRFIFFDAIPIEKPTLVIDIMTPHMGNWYAKGDEIKNINTDTDIIPADWHDPTPIPFLAVKNAKFLFTIAERKGTKKSNSTIDNVFEMLEHALELLGAGAKTQTGYGYMSIEPISTQVFDQGYTDKKNATDAIKAKEDDKIDNIGKPNYYIEMKEIKRVLLKRNLNFTKQYQDIEDLINAALDSEPEWKITYVKQLLELIENEDTAGFLKAKRPKEKFERKRKIYDDRLIKINELKQKYNLISN